MTLAGGSKLGPYEILSSLGAGGMGEVYPARDTRLGRDVAVKILPASFARETDRLHRFEQEARAVAALNHPNILAIFDTGQDNGSPYLVSELLEGETLRAVLDAGVLPQRKTIEYGVQIAQGLAAAHDKGIVHRDLKPENIFVNKDGRIKLLDFGLAKNHEQGFQSAKDLSFALGALSGTDSSGAARIGTTTQRLRLFPWAIAAIALGLGAAATWFFASHPIPQQRMLFAISVSGEVSHMALSADGSILAFVSPDDKSGMPMLYLQRVGSPDVRKLEGTEGVSYPFWSPDGAYVAFFANGKLQKIAVAGGPAQALAK